MVSDSYFWGLIFLGLGVSNSYVSGLVFLRLMVSNSYRFGDYISYVCGLVILLFEG